MVPPVINDVAPKKVWEDRRRLDTGFWDMLKKGSYKVNRTQGKVECQFGSGTLQLRSDFLSFLVAHWRPMGKRPRAEVVDEKIAADAEREPRFARLGTEYVSVGK